MTGSEGTRTTQDGRTRTQREAGFTARACKQRLGTYGIYCDLARGHAGDHSSGTGADDTWMTWGDDV